MSSKTHKRACDFRDAAGPRVCVGQSRPGLPAAPRLVDKLVLLPCGEGARLEQATPHRETGNSPHKEWSGNAPQEPPSGQTVFKAP